VFSLVRLAAPLAVTVGLSACGTSDARLAKLTAGIPKDSAMKVMGGGKPQRIDSYLTGGHMIEGLYYRPPEASETDSLPDRELSVVVVVDGKLLGWGWTAWDSVAGANKIVVAPKPKS